jgi:hypothetical protein
MQYMLMVYVDEAGFPKLSPEEQEQGLAAYAAYTTALKDAGYLIKGERLRPTQTATTVRASNGKTQVLDGPYADTKEQFAGFYIIDVPDLDAALAWAARCPATNHGAVEVRPVWTY